MLGFADFMNANWTSWIYNEKTLQSRFYKVCGHYCVYFISLSWFEMRDITSHFSSNLTENDCRVTSFISDFKTVIKNCNC